MVAVAVAYQESSLHNLPVAVSASRYHFRQ
jgi:hypothetical protein